VGAVREGKVMGVGGGGAGGQRMVGVVEGFGTARRTGGIELDRDSLTRDGN